MLHTLKEYAQTRDIVTPPGFTAKYARWCLVFSEACEFMAVVELGDTESKRNRGQSFNMSPNLSFSEMKAGGIAKSHFLLDALDSIVPYGKDAANPKKVAKRRYFADLLRQADASYPLLARIASELTLDSVQERICIRLTELKAKPTDKATIRLGSRLVIESTSWHDWWQKHRTSLAPAEKPTKATKVKRSPTDGHMLCLLSGESIEPRKVDPKVKGLSDVGGLSTGDVVIGFKQESFCSYGLSQALNAALSEEAATTYTEALNHLLASNRNSRRLADVKAVWWFKERIPVEDDPIPWLADPPQVETDDAESGVRSFLDSVRTGKRRNLADVIYYSLTLSGNSGRVVVRDWMEGQFADLADNIAQWFEDLEIIKRDGTGLTPPPKLMAVLGATVRDLNDLPAPHVAKIWQVAIKGQRIPAWALARALLRVRIDFINGSTANHARMGLLKAYHVRNQRLDRKDITMSAYLNEEHSNPAYQCGRLLAILAAVQKRAIPGVDTGVVQRYYTAASTTPALVLGRLTSTSQHHLNKLDGGLAHWFEDQIAAVWSRIKDAIPATLSLEDQSLFALGYYQQMAHLRTRKADKNEENTNT